MKYRTVVSLLALLSVAHAQTSQDILEDAVAVWEMNTLNSTNGQAPLEAVGAVTVGETLRGIDREASLERGGGGEVAVLSGGYLNAGEGANRQFQIEGDQLTLLLRFKLDEGGLSAGELFSKHGGHEKCSYNLYANRGDIGFEIGTEHIDGLTGSIRIPADMISENAWQTVAARYDGDQITIFLNGVLVAMDKASGDLRENNEPLILGRAMRGEVDLAAIWKRALSDAEIETLGGDPESITRKKRELLEEIEKQTGKDGLTTVDKMRAARELREDLASDRQRPRYHLMPPEGYWNDINGTLYWKGRYHVMFLGRTAPDAQTVLDGIDTPLARETWMHASSADLVHWVQHPPAMKPVFDGSMPRGQFSGDAIDGAPEPTLIYHVPSQGTSISTAADPNDPELIEWTPSPHNPVIPEDGEPDEVVVFDPTVWREEDGTYYALIGNKNRAPGYEGDSTSLYRTTDLINWEYRGPFYKSARKWTHELEDAACPDFFPIGNDKHMLLMHGHRPLLNTHYYIGVWDRENERFIPEQHGRMSWAGGEVCAPETLEDDQGRRIYWGAVRDAIRTSPGWKTVATLPRILSLDEDDTLLIEPVPELEALRYNERSFQDLTISGEQRLDDPGGDLLEIRAEIIPGKAREFGIIVRQSPHGEEQLPVMINLDDNTVYTDISKASLNPKVKYRRLTYKQSFEALSDDQKYVNRQEAPFTLKPGETVDLRIFIDKSIVEIFVNGRQCVTQRIYPTRKDALGISLVSKEAPMTIRNLHIWDMHPTH